jgi:hypothetical protein
MVFLRPQWGLRKTAPKRGGILSSYPKELESV